VSYKILFHPAVGKSLKKLPDKFYLRIQSKINKLAEIPRPSGVVKLEGKEAAWRIRVGSYRIVFLIDDKAKLIKIISIGHRREIYR